MKAFRKGIVQYTQCQIRQGRVGFFFFSVAQRRLRLRGVLLKALMLFFCLFPGLFFFFPCPFRFPFISTGAIPSVEESAHQIEGGSSLTYD